MSKKINIPKIWLTTSRELIRSYKTGFSQEEYSKFKGENEESKKKFEKELEKVLGFQEQCDRGDVEKLKKQWDYKKISFRTFVNI